MAHPIATPQTPSARTNLPVDGDGLRRLRIDLAACLRWAARNGLEEGICNHFSAVLPERPDLFLVVAARNRTVAEAQSRAFSGARSVRLE
ncbi:hypothetical protein LGR69_31640, partial [Methylobacterium brachiatum]|nr:hypothetical protein [Methylobacterium brachiatum]